MEARLDESIYRKLQLMESVERNLLDDLFLTERRPADATVIFVAPEQDWTECLGLGWVPENLINSRLRRKSCYQCNSYQLMRLLGVSIFLIDGRKMGSVAMQIIT